MFNKKSCKRCGKKIEKKFSYCPYCGNSINSEKEKQEYGMLGKNDNLDIFNSGMKMPFGINFLFKNLMKEMEKQFKELDGGMGKEKAIKKRDILPTQQQGEISINISSGDGTPIIRVKSLGDIPEFKEMEKQLKPAETKKNIRKNQISQEKAQELAKLPRQEAESRVRRLSEKVVYEIELPGVNNLRDVIVNELENSIEIKAFAKDKAYFKFLPIGLPLLKYALKNGKLTLELGEK